MLLLIKAGLLGFSLLAPAPVHSYPGPGPQQADLPPRAVAEDLFARMSADPLVKEDVQADAKFLSEHSSWFLALPAAQRAARVKAFNAASENGEAIADPSHSRAQTAAYHSAQARRWNEIKRRYPQVTKMSSQDEGEFLTRLFTALSAKDDPNVKSGCGAGYYVCSHLGRQALSEAEIARNSEACYVGFTACLYASDPQRE